MTIFDNYAARYERTREEEMSMKEYRALQKDKLTYASAPERMLAAIGEPTLVDTRNDTRLSRIFANKVIKIYPAFREFYGTEEVIEQVVSSAMRRRDWKNASRFYLLGPVGGGKSSIAEKLKSLMEHVPFYCLKGSPVNESPLGLFNEEEDGTILEEDYGIPRRYLRNIPARGPSSACMNSMATSTSSAWSNATLPCSSRAISRRNRAMKTIRIFLRWSARSTSANWKTIRRMIPMPTAIRAACAWPIRA
jgi:predicted Ser/Thr protein kinase